MSEETTRVLAALLNLEPTGGLERRPSPYRGTALPAGQRRPAGRCCVRTNGYKMVTKMATGNRRPLAARSVSNLQLAPDQGFEP
jgi:hypothetical protein